MLQSSNLEIPLRVIGPDGTVLWQGSGWLGVVYAAVCKSAAITESNAVMIDPTTTIIQASNLAATTAIVANVLSAKPTTGAAVQGVLGCALNTAAVGDRVVIAGAGSLCLCTTGTAGVIGQFAVPAAAGSTTQSNAGATGPNQNVGRVIKPAGAVGGATDTGTASRLGLLVDTGAATL